MIGFNWEFTWYCTKELSMEKNIHGYCCILLLYLTDFRLVIPGPVAQPIPEDPSCESPPKDFSVSPPVSAAPVPPSSEQNEKLSDKKRKLIEALLETAEYFYLL